MPVSLATSPMPSVASVIHFLLDLNPGSGPRLAGPASRPEEEHVTDPSPISCTLGESDLRRRLDEIAALGTDSLITHEASDGVHNLRFRTDDTTRRRLELIADAEGRCCSFLDLSIDERDGQLVLTIAAPEGGEPVAEALAGAFRGV